MKEKNTTPTHVYLTDFEFEEEEEGEGSLQVIQLNKLK